MKFNEAPSADGVWHHCHLLPAADPAQAIHDGAIVVEQGRIAWLGAFAALPDVYRHLPRHDANGAWITPGLVDCHTHLVYGGQRADEFAMRLAGASYEEIARAGGGIVSTVRATREADEATLFAQAAALGALVAEDVGDRVEPQGEPELAAPRRDHARDRRRHLWAQRHLAAAAVGKGVRLFVNYFLILGAFGFVQLGGLQNRGVILDIAGALHLGAYGLKEPV